MSEMENAIDTAMGFVGLVLMGLLYFLPTVVAVTRKNLNQGAVLVVNLFLGWTFLGWIVALAMAAGGSKPAAPYRPGDVVNGYRFDGAVWTPASQGAPLGRSWTDETGGPA